MGSSLSPDTGGAMKVKRIILGVALWIALPVVGLAGGLYWLAYRPDSGATDCERRISPNERYVAEECLISWGGRDDLYYVGRVCDAKTGTLLVRRRFSTPLPEIDWSDNGNLLFSRGGDDASYVELPPSLFDRITAWLPLS
jgi:hypothetical protein